MPRHIEIIDESIQCAWCGGEFVPMGAEVYCSRMCENDAAESRENAEEYTEANEREIDYDWPEVPF